MSIFISQNNLKAAGGPVKGNTGGFLLFRVLEKEAEGRFSILLSGKRVRIHSSIPLKVGSSYRASASVDAGRVELKNLRALPNDVSDPVVSAGKFTGTSRLGSRSLAAIINSVCQKRDVVLPDASKSVLIKKLKMKNSPLSRYIHKNHDFSSIISAGTISSFAAKGLAPDSDMISLFASVLFGGASKESASFEESITLFNGSRDRHGYQWKVFPFSYGQAAASMRGSFTVGIDQASVTRLFNVNWSAAGQPVSVHIDLQSRNVFFCGDYFKSDVINPLKPYFDGIGYRLISDLILPGDFDGFYIYSDNGETRLSL